MQKKSEKCYMTFKITPFCKKRERENFLVQKSKITLKSIGVN